MTTEALVQKLQTSRNYRDICPDTIARIVHRCEARYKPSEREKAVKTQLHGISTAFMTDSEIKRANALLETISEDDGALEALLSLHASTRERMPLSDADALYEKLWKVTGAPRDVLDLACGLNPIYLGSRLNCPVVGLDISGSCIRLIEASPYAPRIRAVCADLLCSPDEMQAPHHVALLFKILPLLDRQEKDGARSVLNALRSEYVILSFPLKTLGGKNVGMRAHYEAAVEATVPTERYERISTIEHEGREIYVVLQSR